MKIAIGDATLHFFNWYTWSLWTNHSPVECYKLVCNLQLSMLFAFGVSLRGCIFSVGGIYDLTISNVRLNEFTLGCATLINSHLNFPCLN